MTASNLPYTLPTPGSQLDWLGVDPNGSVGFFSSSGYGPVPAIVVTHLEAVRVAIARLSKLPILAPCLQTPREAGAHWREPADRGLFGFDWHIYDGPYQRLTVPSQVLHIDEVSDMGVRGAARLVGLRAVFADTPSLGFSEMGIELYSGRELQ